MGVRPVDEIFTMTINFGVTQPLLNVTIARDFSREISRKFKPGEGGFNGGNFYTGLLNPYNLK